MTPERDLVAHTGAARVLRCRRLRRGGGGRAELVRRDERHVDDAGTRRQETRREDGRLVGVRALRDRHGVLGRELGILDERALGDDGVGVDRLRQIRRVDVGHLHLGPLAVDIRERHLAIAAVGQVGDRRVGRARDLVPGHARAEQRRALGQIRHVHGPVLVDRDRQPVVVLDQLNDLERAVLESEDAVRATVVERRRGHRFRDEPDEVDPDVAGERLRELDEGTNDARDDALTGDPVIVAQDLHVRVALEAPDEERLRGQDDRLVELLADGAHDARQVRERDARPVGTLVVRLDAQGDELTHGGLHAEVPGALVRPVPALDQLPRGRGHGVEAGEHGVQPNERNLQRVDTRIRLHDDAIPFDPLRSLFTASLPGLVLEAPRHCKLHCDGIALQTIHIGYY